MAVNLESGGTVTAYPLQIITTGEIDTRPFSTLVALMRGDRMALGSMLVAFDVVCRELRMEYACVPSKIIVPGNVEQ